MTAIKIFYEHIQLNLDISKLMGPFLARLTESRGSYCRTPGVRRRRCQRQRPHLVKVSLKPLISQITLLCLAYVLLVLGDI